MKLLLVEDNEKLARSLKKGLEAEGYAVDREGDGKTAFERGSSDPGESYDLAVLDLMLPSLDGMEICRRWRERGVLFPVIMLTARDSVEDRVRGLDVGADDYLPKPFAFDELSARIRALLRRPRETHAAPYKAGDIEIDPAGHSAIVAGTRGEPHPEGIPAARAFRQELGSQSSPATISSATSGISNSMASATSSTST